MTGILAAWRRFWLRRDSRYSEPRVPVRCADYPTLCAFAGKFGDDHKCHDGICWMTGFLRTNHAHDAWMR